MSDYLYFHDTNENSRYAVSMFALRLVAFFPKDGWMIFQGYSRLEKDELPYSVDALRTNSERLVELFKLRITEVVTKVVEPPSWKDDRGEGCIRFFPSNIVIYRFDPCEPLKNADKDWSFCIDKRFESPEALLERYMSLVDDPGFCEPYMPREEDQEFYDEFDGFIREG